MSMDIGYSGGIYAKMLDMGVHGRTKTIVLLVIQDQMNIKP